MARAVVAKGVEEKEARVEKEAEATKEVAVGLLEGNQIPMAPFPIAMVVSMLVQVR